LRLRSGDAASADSTGRAGSTVGSLATALSARTWPRMSDHSCGISDLRSTDGVEVWSVEMLVELQKRR
jgi:hypothetical protein